MVLCAGFVVLRANHEGPVYIPGKSFSKYRADSGSIARNYTRLMWFGAAGLVASLVWVFAALINHWSLQPIAYAFGGSIAAACTGYRGRISVAVHDDVDPVAVETLRSTGLVSRDKVYASYQNFDPSPAGRGLQPKRRQFVVGVQADRFVAQFCDGRQWHSICRTFRDVRAIGVHTDDKYIVHLLLRFDENAQYELKFDPDQRLTTEPLSFVRGFLRTLDAAVLGASNGNQVSSRRRVAPQSEASGLNARVPVARYSLPAVELDDSLVHAFGATIPVPSNRSLELDV
jgi:hypothetical protein